MAGPLVIQVSKHALQRYRERLGKPGASFEEIADHARRARYIPKNEPLPYPVARVVDRVYRYCGEAMFVLAPTNMIDVLQLITVYTPDVVTAMVQPKSVPQKNLDEWVETIRVYIQPWNAPPSIHPTDVKYTFRRIKPKLWRAVPNTKWAREVMVTDNSCSCYTFKRSRTTCDHLKALRERMAQVVDQDKA